MPLKKKTAAPKPTLKKASPKGPKLARLKAATPIETVKHQDKRANNIPTEELRDFVAEAEKPLTQQQLNLLI